MLNNISNAFQTLRKYESFQKTQFSSGNSVSTASDISIPNIGHGWIMGRARKGVLLVGDDEGDMRPAVYVPSLEVICLVMSVSA